MRSIWSGTGRWRGSRVKLTDQNFNLKIDFRNSLLTPEYYQEQLFFAAH